MSQSDLSQPKSKKSTSLIVPLSIVLLFVSLGATFIYLNTTYPGLFANSINQIYNTVIPENNQAAHDSNIPESISLTLPSTTPLPTPLRSPYPLTPNKGTAGTYRVSHSSGNGPTITNVEIDPLNVKSGEEVKVTLTLTHPTPIQKISTRLETDSSPVQFDFQPVYRTNNTESWVANFRLTNSVLYKYIYVFTSSDGTNTSTLPMGLRN